ncbi:hypothetical protein ACQCSV_13470 [Pseudarthrobacter sp. S3]
MDTDYCWLDDVVGVDYAALGAALSAGLAGANFNHVESEPEVFGFLTAA